MDDGLPPSSLKNLGAKSDAMLAEVGVDTIGDLKRLGPIEVYRRLKAARPRQVNLMFLYAMVAGLMGMHVNDLPPDLKDQLRKQV